MRIASLPLLKFCVQESQHGYNKLARFQASPRQLSLKNATAPFRCLCTTPKRWQEKPCVDSESAFVRHNSGVSVSALTNLSEEEMAFKETVQKLAKNKIEPVVRKMDIASKMDADVIKSLFDNGVRFLKLHYDS